LLQQSPELYRDTNSRALRRFPAVTSIAIEAMSKCAIQICEEMQWIA
jgi:hypothetical protein